LRQRLRAGELDAQRLRLAAYLGDANAQAASGFVPDAVPFAIWLDGLDGWNKQTQVRAGIALLRRALDERASLPDRPERATLRALKEAEAWCLDPSDPSHPAWWVLEEAQAAALIASGIDQEIGWLACEDAGALAVAAIERPELAGKRYNISGVEAPTGPELAGIFSGALGREISYYAMAPEEMGDVIDAAFGPGSGDRIAEMYRREQTDPNPEAKYHDMAPVLRALPVSMTSIHQWATQNSAAFDEDAN